MQKNSLCVENGMLWKVGVRGSGHESWEQRTNTWVEQSSWLWEGTLTATDNKALFLEDIQSSSSEDI